MSETKKNPWSNLRTGVSSRRKARYSRQHESAEKERRSKNSRGGNRGGFWKNELKIQGPKKDKQTGAQIPGVPVVMRLVPGEYPVPNHVAAEFEEFTAGEVLPNFMQIEYRHGTIGRFGVDVPDTRDTEEGKDLSLYLIDNGDDTINPRLINYYNVLDLGSWHKVPVEEPYTDKKTNESKVRQGFEWYRCKGRTCNLCDQGLEKIHGRAGYLRMTPAFETALNSIANTVGQFCTCGCPAPLTALAATCSSCGHVFVEAEFEEVTGEITDPISPRKIGQVYDQHANCPNCGNHLVEAPEQDDECTVAEELTCDGCTDPQRASIYDADLALIKEGEAPKTLLKLNDDMFNARGFRVREVPEALAEQARVFDFEKSLPRSLSYVAKRLELSPADNPYYAPPEGAEDR
ncbi:MAG: hypothetical protein KDB07_11420 [Planctomycetes bacterium]|nr:hypothetical protein [Planctomycetota bacterium]